MSIWEVWSGRRLPPLPKFPSLQGPPTWVIFGPEDNQFSVTGSDDSSVRICDIRTGRELGRFDLRGLAAGWAFGLEASRVVIPAVKSWGQAMTRAQPGSNSGIPECGGASSSLKDTLARCEGLSAAATAGESFPYRGIWTCASGRRSHGRARLTRERTANRSGIVLNGMHVLHGTAGAEPPGKAVARWLWHYAPDPSQPSVAGSRTVSSTTFGTENTIAFNLRKDDGDQMSPQVVVVEVRYGEDVFHWWFKPGEEETDQPGPGRVVWRGSNPRASAEGQALRLYLRTWDNPRPDAWVESLTYESALTDSVPFLIAVTVE